MIEKRQTIKERLRNSNGFTMIEVISVLIILGIVAAMVISRGMSTNVVKLQSEVDVMKGHLRFAQYRAMNDIAANVDTKWGINVAGDTYTLVKVDTSGPTSPLNLPGESSGTPASHTFANGVTASVTGDNPILFNEWGSPGANATTVTVGGKTINITANTGFIP